MRLGWSETAKRARLERIVRHSLLMTGIDCADDKADEAPNKEPHYLVRDSICCVIQFRRGVAKYQSCDARNAGEKKNS